MKAAELQDLMQTMKGIASSNSLASPKSESVTNKEIESFSDLFSKQIDKINSSQMEAQKLQESFLLGDSDVSVAQATMAGKKAEILTQMLIHTRDKVIGSYNDIMNMQV